MTLALTMIYDDRIQWNFAETAYWWIHHGGYGSEAKALRAVRRRKGMDRLDETTLRRRFGLAVAICRQTVELCEAEIGRHGHDHRYRLSAEEHADGTSRIEAALHEAFPGSEDTVDYMVGMLWEMPYER